MLTECYCSNVSSLRGAAFERALAVLPWEERREKARRYYFERDRQLCVGAGLLLLHALRRAGVSRTRLVYGEYGKPMLEDAAQGVYISCSHSGEFAVCAVSPRHVGVDIERIAPVDSRVTRRVFTPEEQQWIGTDETAFYRLWTRKESIMKLLGTGMMLPARGICVLDGSPLLENCQFTEYSVDGCCLTVCGEACSGLHTPDILEVLQGL